MVAVAAAVVLALASAAWACTAIMGPLTISPTSGPAGAIISASATGLKVAPAEYKLVFGGECHTGSDRVTIKRRIKTNNNGAFSGVSAKIPSKSPGEYVICALETSPVRNQTASNHQKFTII